MKARSLRYSLVAAVLVVVGLGRPSKANAPTGRYSMTDLIVFDLKTKLTWQRTAPTTMMPWADALSYCADPATATALGGGSWRLPTVKELLTLVDYGQANAAMIDANAFPGTPMATFWSATLLAGFFADGWSVDFSRGSMFAGELSNATFVRCVQ